MKNLFRVLFNIFKKRENKKVFNDNFLLFESINFVYNKNGNRTIILNNDVYLVTSVTDEKNYSYKFHFHLEKKELVLLDNKKFNTLKVIYIKNI
jgi:hypothetical protein